MVFGRDCDRVARQRAFDAVVVINDFERAEIKFANMVRGERIFAAALAALERPHETSIALSITIIRLFAYWGNKKPLLMKMRRG